MYKRWALVNENYGTEKFRDDATPLFATTGYWDKRHDWGEWCLKQGKGRVAGLTAGHMYFAYRVKNYQKLFQRSIELVTNREVSQG